jgi:hypothetical protein
MSMSPVVVAVEHNQKKVITINKTHIEPKENFSTKKVPQMKKKLFGTHQIGNLIKYMLSNKEET